MQMSTNGRAEWILSVQGTSCPDECPAGGILDTGAGLTAMSASVAEKLQKKFPDVSVFREY